LELKELGLKVEFAFGHYNYDTHKMRDYKNERVTKSFFAAPLYQQAFDFFEEKYFLSGEVQKQAPYQNVTKPYWWYLIQDGKGSDVSNWQGRFAEILDKAHQNKEGNFVDDDKFIKFLYDDNFGFKTRNEAKLECLKKLIEIVKEII
jgi:hypothetical protein